MNNNICGAEVRVISGKGKGDKNTQILACGLGGVRPSEVSVAFLSVFSGDSVRGISSSCVGDLIGRTVL